MQGAAVGWDRCARKEMDPSTDTARWLMDGSTCRFGQIHSGREGRDMYGNEVDYSQDRTTLSVGSVYYG